MHQPVLLEEAIGYLDPQPGQNFIDATFGEGGHSRAMLYKIGPQGRLLGIDANPAASQGLKLDHANLVTVNDNFSKLKEIYEHFFTYPVHGILFDLGLSTPLLEESGRGFSFAKDEPLDMRFNPDKQRLTAAEVLNNYSLDKLYIIFKEFGEYAHARLLSKGILEERRKKRFATTRDLVETVLKYHFSKGRERIHPATKVFQALRIEVNRELESLVEALPQAFEILESGGRLVVISFHSLEDRIVKNYFRELGKEGRVKILTKKPLAAGGDEIEENPRARSAKLRAVIKL